jgi:hypothetical protein
MLDKPPSLLKLIFSTRNQFIAEDPHLVSLLRAEALDCSVSTGFVPLGGYGRA